MNHVASDRIFLLASLVAVACAAFYEPVIYGNDMGSIERYLRQEMGSRLKDGIELLTVADDGADRFAVFRGAEKRPDERWIVRFRQNENGDYEAYLNSRRMYGPHPVQGVYTQPRTSAPSSTTTPGNRTEFSTVPSILQPSATRESTQYPPTPT